MALSAAQKAWYRTKIAELDPTSDVVCIDVASDQVHYSAAIRSDESHTKPLTPEEYVHALTAVMLVKELGYPVGCLYHERHIEHGSAGSKADEVDFIVLDSDGRPYAVWELKSAEAYLGDVELATKSQLFGTVPLLTEEAPAFIICATINPIGAKIELKQRCIDYREYKDYQIWIDEGKPTVPSFPQQYWEPNYQPYVRGGVRDLKITCTLSEFRAVAESFHNEFFSEHPDNQLFEYVVKCLLAKIHSEKNTPAGEPYQFQVFLPHGKPESAAEVASRVNTLYVLAHRHYIEPSGSDEIDLTRFAPERIKSIVQQLEGMALTKGSALNADVMGAFFEEILRSGFKQDRGMYFTHDNIARFMIEAVGLPSLTKTKWRQATHPDNRLPYVIDPACGSGTFLLHSMHAITEVVRSEREWFSRTENDERFLDQNFSDNAPNGWAKDFLYGLDPKFIMAITAKLNMVLHGDGVAHLFKDDAFKPMDSYNDGRLRPVGAPDRSLSTNVYPPAMCEMFDVVVSNPPFGVTLSTETRQTLSRAFMLPATFSTEALFIERAFQLLRPNGRLAVVLPESVLNAADTSLRLFVMRMFHIRAVVTMPRHIFVDTPTLTSLLFAQKKTGAEVTEWDHVWAEEAACIEKRVAVARRHLTVAGRKAFASAAALQAAVLDDLAAVGGRGAWVMRRGQQNGGPLGFSLPPDIEEVADAVKHYQLLLQTPSFQDLVSRAIFSAVAGRLDCEWPCYAVEKIGFKLSKRGERIRENQLARFIGQSGTETPNLHLASEPASVMVDNATPSTVLDFMSLDMAWT